MDTLFSLIGGECRSCHIRITSRHIVHDMERFAKYGVVPSLFDQSAPDSPSSTVDPEDFPEEMDDALDEILLMEQKKFGSPAYVNDPFAPVGEDEDEEDEIEAEPLTPVEEFGKKLEMLAKMFALDEGEDDTMVFETTGTIERCIRDGNEVIELRYAEDASMDGTETVIRYDRKKPHSATVTHGGGVMSTLICDEGVRHISVYQTPVMPFEIALYTKKCKGFFSLDGGVLELDYILELRGADLQRTVMTIEAFPN